MVQLCDAAIAIATPAAKTNVQTPIIAQPMGLDARMRPTINPAINSLFFAGDLQVKGSFVFLS